MCASFSVSVTYSYWYPGAAMRFALKAKKKMWKKSWCSGNANMTKVEYSYFHASSCSGGWCTNPNTCTANFRFEYIHFSAHIRITAEWTNRSIDFSDLNFMVSWFFMCVRVKALNNHKWRRSVLRSTTITDQQDNLWAFFLSALKVTITRSRFSFEEKRASVNVHFSIKK